MTEKIWFLIPYAVAFIGLIVVNIIQMVAHDRQRKAMQKEISDLRDRFMAKDYHDYAVGQHIMGKRQMSDKEMVEALYDVTEEDKEQADRLPVT